MNEAAFLINLNTCKIILNEYELLKKVNLKNVTRCSFNKYSSEFRKISKKNEYANTFIAGIEMDDYDFLLKDGSYFQFSFDKNDTDFEMRFAFYPTINNISYLDFLYEFLEADLESCGGVFIEEYQQFLSEQEIKFVSPIRYDYNSRIYKPLVHSASHIHIGYEENIRLPVDKILSPTAFVKVVLQYYYFDRWKDKANSDDRSICFIKNSEFEGLNGVYFSLDDRQLPYISWINN